MTKLMDSQIADTGAANLAVLGQAKVAMKHIRKASAQMPRIAVLSGPPGYGKSQAAAHMCHPLTENAAYIGLLTFDTTRSIAERLLKELDIRFKANWTTAQKFEAICQYLMETNRPLVVDEFDHVAEKTIVDFFRAIHDQAATPIFIIGEQDLQHKLQRHHERFHDRVLTWVKATPCDDQDTRLLTRHYAPNLKWSDAAIAALQRKGAGVARRITTDIERVKEFCKQRSIVDVLPEHVGGR
ncbi:ATP-binding protein [Pseudacidovorax intermedius]|uniref:ATP-binding protein n=1 Tax=Pseudacidovorax intermedius TaxID=433924 RepID=UPI0026F2549F|nr:ATP-binding protein [Pseudacidovorax intermedius]